MWTTNHDVWTVPVTGGEPTRVTSNPAADMQPVFSPDGKSILVRAQRRPGFEADRWYLDVYDRSSGRASDRVRELRIFRWRISASRPTAPRSWFSSTSHGAVNLYRVPLAGRRAHAGPTRRRDRRVPAGRTDSWSRPGPP